MFIDFLFRIYHKFYLLQTLRRNVRKEPQFSKWLFPGFLWGVDHKKQNVENWIVPSSLVNRWFFRPSYSMIYQESSYATLHLSDLGVPYFHWKTKDFNDFFSRWTTSHFYPYKMCKSGHNAENWCLDNRHPVIFSFLPFTK